MEVAVLLIRAVAGLVVAAHGAQKVFGWFGGHGPDGTASFLETLGFRPGRPYAWLLGGAELAGGLALALGLVTPVAAAAVAGVMLAATAAVHWGHGLFASDGGFELPLVLGATAIAVAFSGPGRYSLDEVLGWELAGTTWGLAALLLAVVAGTSVLATRAVELPRWRKRPTATA